MKFGFCRGGLLLSSLAALALVVAGCGQADNKDAQADNGRTPTDNKVAKSTDNKAGKGGEKKAEPKHDGWWCAEHGIPEKICSLCLPDAEVKTQFKDKGDWCDKHERAKSQCFKCDPKLREKFAAQYRAKYGKEPPPIEDDEKKEDEKSKKDGDKS